MHITSSPSSYAFALPANPKATRTAGVWTKVHSDAVSITSLNDWHADSKLVFAFAAGQERLDGSWRVSDECGSLMAV